MVQLKCILVLSIVSSLCLAPSFAAGVHTGSVGRHDIPVNGACKQEIMQYCASLLPTKAKQAAVPTGQQHEQQAQPHQQQQQQVQPQKQQQQQQQVQAQKQQPQHQGAVSPQNSSFPLQSNSSETARSQTLDRLVLIVPAGNHTLRRRRSLMSISEDHSPTELLKQLSKTFGYDIPSRGGQLASCVRLVLRQSEFSIASDSPQISLACAQEIESFDIAKAQDIKYDVPLLLQCGWDILETCNQFENTTYSIMACLKDNKHKLHPDCKNTVIQLQKNAAGNMALDADFYNACKGDLQAACPKPRYGPGEAQACLESVDRGEVLGRKLSQGCGAALFRRHVEEGEDIRFNYLLSSACALDKQMFCADVKPGLGQVIRCLEHFKKDPSFSEACRSGLEGYVVRKSLDIRLDFQFRSLCGPLVKSFCAMDPLPSLGAYEGPEEGVAIAECMRRNIDHIANVPCKQHMYMRMVDAFHDNRLDPMLSQECGVDARRLCKHPQTSLNCLKTIVAQGDPVAANVSSGCQELVMTRMREAATDVNFNPLLVSNCVVERQVHCGHAHQADELLCLADHRAQPDFSQSCREAVMSSLIEMSTDMRLFHTLRVACQQDITALCSGVQPGEGRVISCLQEHRGQVNSSECKHHMLRFLGLVVEDPRLDHQLMQACRSDAQQYCGGVSLSELHQCLRRSEEHLSPDCRAMETRLEAAENDDVAINPKIAMACGAAVSRYCKDQKPGSANLLRCLQLNMAAPEFPRTCKDVMKALLDRAVVRYSLNSQLRQACDADVAASCPAEGGDVASADAALLACLTGNVSTLSSACQRELGVLVRYQFTRYRMGMPLTSACDGDVLTWCHVDKLSTPFLEKGFVFDCLLHHYSKLHQPCWALISIFDESVYATAAKLESQEMGPGAIGPGGGSGGGGSALSIKALTAEVRRELEPKLLHNIVSMMAKDMQRRAQDLGPKITMLMSGAGLIFAAFIVTLIVLVIVYQKKAIRSGISVVKDGKV